MFCSFSEMEAPNFDQYSNVFMLGSIKFLFMFLFIIIISHEPYDRVLLRMLLKAF